MKKINFRNFINVAINFIAIFMFIEIFIILIVVDTKDDYNYANYIKPANYKCLILILALSFIFILTAFITKKYFKNKLETIKKIYAKICEKSTIIISIIFILLFIFQIVVLQNIFFETGWDVEDVFSTIINYGETGVFDNHSYGEDLCPYFSIYPNNLFLARIFAIIGKILMFFKLSSITIYKALVLLDIILVDLAGIVMVKTIGNFTNRKSIKLLGTLLFVAFVGISPWFLVPYSDTYSILFPITVLYCYTKKEKRIYHYILIGLCSYLGYLIKPTSIIILIAIVLIELYKTLFKLKDKEQMKNIVKNVLCVIAGIILVVLFNFGLQNIVKYNPDKEYEFSLYHYLMLGIGQQSTGAFSHLDMNASLSIHSYDERVEFNKNTFIERLKSLSAGDFCDFYSKKILVNYNDGTLAWGREGNFYNTVYSRGNIVAKVLRSIYYNDGRLFPIFSSFMQVTWIGILMLIIIALIFKKFDNKMAVTALALIGITLFTLLFEARARYLYLYTPYYVLLAVMGIEAIYDKYKKIIKKD